MSIKIPIYIPSSIAYAVRRATTARPVVSTTSPATTTTSSTTTVGITTTEWTTSTMGNDVNYHSSTEATEDITDLDSTTFKWDDALEFYEELRTLVESYFAEFSAGEKFLAMVLLGMMLFSILRCMMTICCHRRVTYTVTDTITTTGVDLEAHRYSEAEIDSDVFLDFPPAPEPEATGAEPEATGAGVPEELI